MPAFFPFCFPYLVGTARDCACRVQGSQRAVKWLSPVLPWWKVLVKLSFPGVLSTPVPHCDGNRPRITLLVASVHGDKFDGSDTASLGHLAPLLPTSRITNESFVCQHVHVSIEAPEHGSTFALDLCHVTLSVLVV